jgi:DNA-binding NarL/FixJ family response regulator
MPTHLEAFHRKEALHLPPRRSRLAVECRRTAWPVNEIVLAALVHAGKSAAQIAVELGVSVDHVRALREDYDI